MMLYFFRILKNFVKYFSDGKVIMDKRIKLVIRLVLIFGGTVIGILLGLRLAIYFAPFLIAFAISSMIEPVIRFLMKKLKFRRKICGIGFIAFGFVDDCNTVAYVVFQTL